MVPAESIFDFEVDVGGGPEISYEVEPSGIHTGGMLVEVEIGATFVVGDRIELPEIFTALPVF